MEVDVPDDAVDTRRLLDINNAIVSEQIGRGFLSAVCPVSTARLGIDHLHTRCLDQGAAADQTFIRHSHSKSFVGTRGRRLLVILVRLLCGQSTGTTNMRL